MSRPNKTSYKVQDGSTQAIGFTGTAGTSAAVGSYTTVVRLVSNQDCFFRITSAGTPATTSDVPLPASTPEYFGISPGAKISVVQSSAAGTLYITEATE